MPWEPRTNIIYFNIGNNLTLYMKQIDREQNVRVEVLFIPAIGISWDVIDSTTITSAEELTAFMDNWLKSEAKHHVENI